MKECLDTQNLHRRLSKIIGQLGAIDRMIEEDVSCEDLLIQIHSAKNALHKVGQLVLEGHLRHTIEEGEDTAKMVESTLKAVEVFSRMTQ